MFTYLRQISIIIIKLKACNIMVLETLAVRMDLHRVSHVLNMLNEYDQNQKETRNITEYFPMRGCWVNKRINEKTAGLVDT